MTNEEKILELLEKQGQVLDQHSVLLEQHSVLLEKQGRVLDQHSILLEQRGQDIAKINICLENVIEPKLEALAEGQRTLLEMLAPKSRVENLEDEVSFLKQMLKTLASEVDDLKKAQ